MCELNNSALPLLGFAAYSGTGKTTLLVKLIPLLKSKGINISVIKHAHHLFDVDQPGKDSYRLRKAGATQTLVTSQHRWALMTELAQEKEPDLREMCSLLDSTAVDLVLVEGFKNEQFDKIELHRHSLGHDLMYRYDQSIIALACDHEVALTRTIPLLNINDVASIVDFILSKYFPDKG